MNVAGDLAFPRHWVMTSMNSMPPKAANPVRGPGRRSAIVAATAVLLLGLVVVLFLGARRSAPPISVGELKALYGTAQSKFVDVGGMPVHYFDEGQGPVILMLHGSFGNLHTFDDIALQLKDRYRVIRFDQPPAGLSGPAPDGFSLNPEQFVHAFLAAVGVPRVAVLATSSGGILAYRHAATYPEEVSALILSNVPPSAPVDNAGAMRRAPFFTRLSLTACLKYAKPWSRTCTEDFLRSVIHRPERVTEEVVAQYYDFGRRADSRQPNTMTGIMRKDDEVQRYLSQVKAPVKLVWGALDHVLPPSTAAMMAQRLSSTTTETAMLADVSHYPPLEAPAEVAAAVDQFLQRLPGIQ